MRQKWRVYVILMASNNQKIDIVMFNMSSYADWQKGYANRNLHILHHLLKDERVRKIVAIDYLPFTWRRAIRAWWEGVVRGPEGETLVRNIGRRLTAVKNSEITKVGYGLPDQDQNIVAYKLFNYSSITSFFSEELFLKQLVKDLDKLDLKNVVLWSYLPTFAGYFKRLGEKLSVFDAVDNWLLNLDFKKFVVKLKQNYQTIRYKADLIFTTAPALVDFFEREQNCYFLPNGVNLPSVDNKILVGRDIVSIPKPIIGYCGVIQENRVDIDLIAAVAKLNPNKSFVLLGRVSSGLKKIVKQKLLPLKNVYLLGRKPHSEVMSYSSHFDVGFIPYLVNDFNAATNSLKLYEFLASGKPVVATPTSGAIEFKDLVYLANTPEEFSQSLTKALSEDNFELKQKRIAVAGENIWGKRVDFMLEKITKQMDNLN